MEVADSHNALHSSSNPTTSNGTADQPFVKDEFYGAGVDADDTYKPRPQLPKPQVGLRSLADLIRDLQNGIIDVDPEYQREVVWTAERMTGLIDSLMENFYIPPIILNAKSQPASNGNGQYTKLVCVDGKQRLTSVRFFVQGMIPCHDYRGEKWWFCAGKKHRNVLSQQNQKMFLNKDFVAFEFTELSPGQEEDLFARVQMGVQLTVAEKMRATTGPWQELAKLFVDDFPVIYSLMNDRSHAKDFQITLSCFSQIMEVMHPTAPNGIPILKTNYVALPKLLGNKSSVNDGMKSHLASVWRSFKDLIESDADVFTNANKYLRGVQTFAPIEMVAVAVLISMYSDTRNNQLLLGDIRALREALRAQFIELRLNATVWRFVWDYLDNLEAHRGAVNGDTIDRRLLDQPSKSTASRAKAVASSSKSSTVVPSVPVSTSASMPATLPAPALAVRKANAKPKTKTSHRPTTPLQNAIAVKQEQGLGAPSLIPRPLKRQRTDLGPSARQQTVVSQSDSPSTSALDSRVAPTIPTSPPKPTQHLPQHAAPPPPTNLMLKTTVPLTSGIGDFTSAPYSSLYTTTASLRSQGPFKTQQSSAVQVANMLPQAATLPLQQTTAASRAPMQLQPQTIPERRQVQDMQPRDTLEQTSSFMPLHARHNITSPINSQHASANLTDPPTQPVPVLGVNSALFSSQTNETRGAFYQFMVSQSPHTSASSSKVKIRGGTYAPTYIEQSWEDVAEPVPTQTDHILPLASTTHVPTNQRKRRSITRPTPAQCDEAIDLTSDGELEQERRDLLSSFKVHTGAGKLPQPLLPQQQAPVDTPQANSCGSAPTWFVFKGREA